MERNRSQVTNLTGPNVYLTDNVNNLRTIQNNSTSDNIDCNIPNQTVMYEPLSSGSLTHSPACHMSDDFVYKTKGTSNINSIDMMNESCHWGLKVPVQLPESVDTLSESPFNVEISTSHINTNITKCLFPPVKDLNFQVQGQLNQTLCLKDQHPDGTIVGPNSKLSLLAVGLPTYSNRNPPPNLPCMTVYSSSQFYHQAEMSITTSIQTMHDNTLNRYFSHGENDTHAHNSNELLRNCYSTFNIKHKKVLLTQYENSIESNIE